MGWSGTIWRLYPSQRVTPANLYTAPVQSIGFCIGERDHYNLANLPADGEQDVAGALASMEADGCVSYNAGPKRRASTPGEKEKNVDLMYLIKKVSSSLA